MLNADITTCPHCGAKTSGRWERLTPGLVRSLVALWTRVVESGVNSVHLRRDLELDKTAYNNFQKLRYFGLAIKDDTSPGHWLVTRRGAKFLHGRERVNQFVLIYRNHIQKRSEEMVDILDVLKCKQYWPSKHDFYMDRPLCNFAPMPEHARPDDGWLPDYSRAVQGEMFVN